MRETMEQARAGVYSETHLQVSLDVDFLDPDSGPPRAPLPKWTPT